MYPLPQNPDHVPAQCVVYGDPDGNWVFEDDNEWKLYTWTRRARIERARVAEKLEHSRACRRAGNRAGNIVALKWAAFYRKELNKALAWISHFEAIRGPLFVELPPQERIAEAAE